MWQIPYGTGLLALYLGIVCVSRNAVLVDDCCIHHFQDVRRPLQLRMRSEKGSFTSSPLTRYFVFMNHDFDVWRCDWIEPERPARTCSAQPKRRSADSITYG
jgi:hypothetical protein